MRRKMLCLSACCLLLTGCAGQTADSAAESAAETTAPAAETASGDAAYIWYLKPSVEAEDIIVTDIDFPDSKQHYAAEEAAIIKRDGKFGFIRCDGKFLTAPEYARYGYLLHAFAAECLELLDDEKGSLQLYNGTDGIHLRTNSPLGIGYVPASYYAVDGMEDVVVTYGDAEEGEFLPRLAAAEQMLMIVQHAEGALNAAGKPCINRDSITNAFGIGNAEGIALPCEYTGGISAYNFYTPVVALEQNGKWGYFDLYGKCVIDCICEPMIFPDAAAEGGLLPTSAYQFAYSGAGVPYNPTENMIAVRTEAGCGYYNMQGDEVIPPGTFAQTRPFHHGLAWVQDAETGLWGIIQLADSEITLDFSAPATSDTPQQTEPAETDAPAEPQLAYYGTIGVVQGNGGTVPMYHRPDSEVIRDALRVLAEVPDQSAITLLQLTRDDFGGARPWYLADYNGQIGYLDAQFIQDTGEKCEMQTAQLNAVAEKLLLTALFAEWEGYPNCFVCSRHNAKKFDVGLDEPEDGWVLEGIHSKAEWADAIHQYYSPKYDAERFVDFKNGLDGGFGDSPKSGAIYFMDGDQVYYCSHLGNYRGENFWVFPLMDDPHQYIHLAASDYIGTEIFFTGSINHDSYYGGIVPVERFSIIFEDGKWKIGALTEPY